MILGLKNTRDENKNVAVVGISVFVAALIIGVFEAGAPFVQGSTYFIMWFLVGVTIGCSEVNWNKEV